MQEPALAEKMQQVQALGRTMDYLREQSTQHVDLLAMLLCNLTVQEEDCKTLLQLGQGDKEGLNV